MGEMVELSDRRHGKKQFANIRVRKSYGNMDRYLHY